MTTELAFEDFFPHTHGGASAHDGNLSKVLKSQLCSYAVNLAQS